MHCNPKSKGPYQCQRLDQVLTCSSALKFTRVSIDNTSYCTVSTICIHKLSAPAICVNWLTWLQTCGHRIGAPISYKLHP